MQNFKTALICGGTQGIGLALVRVLLNSNSSLHIFATYRAGSDLSSLQGLQDDFASRLTLLELNIDNEEQYQALSESVAKKCDSLDLCINCIGIIKGRAAIAEKSIAEFDPKSYLEAIQVNAMPTALLAKYLYQNLKHSKSPVFVALSAKVGSIDDNQLGGWYSYRSSKAALNMIIKNLSIEWNRFKSNCLVMAVHPGTTETNMTKDFLGAARKKYQIHTPEQTAVNILELLNVARQKEYNGKLVTWDQKVIPW